MPLRRGGRTPRDSTADSLGAARRLLGQRERGGVRRLVRRSRDMSRRTAAIVLLASVVVALIAGGAAQVRVDTSTESFLPSGDPSIDAMNEKASDFGGDPIVVLLHGKQPRSLLADHDQLMGMVRLEGTLSHLPNVAAVYGPATALNQIAGSAQDFLIQIAGRRDGARLAAEKAAVRAGQSPEAASAAGQQAADEFTARYAPILVQGLPVGLPTLNNPAFAGHVIYGEDGGPRSEWRAIAPDAGSVAVLVRPRQELDQAATASLVSAVRSSVDRAGLATSSVTISGVPVVTSDLSSEIVREVPLLSGLVAVAVLLRLLLLRGAPRRLRWVPVASIMLGAGATFAVFGWSGHAMSFGAVALTPVLLGVGSAFPIYLTLLRATRSLVALSMANALAFASLALTPLPFVRELGLALGLGVALTTIIALTLIRMVSGHWSGPEGRPSAATTQPMTARRRGALLGALVLAVLIAGFGWTALPRLNVAADPQQLAAGVPAVTDAARVEQVMGSSGEVSVVLRGPDTASPAALAWSRTANAEIQQRFGRELRPILGSAQLLAFLGEHPTPEQVTAALRIVPSYLSSSVIRADRQASLDVYGVGLQDVGTQTATLTALRASLPPAPPGYRADVVGLPVAAGDAYRALLSDRYLLSAGGIIVAGLALFVGLRTRTDALRAGLSAAMATGETFAVLAMFHVSLSPLTVGLGALVAVSGCEFFVLLREVEGSDRRTVLGVVLAGLTSAIGYASLCASQLEVIRQFGLVLTGSVCLSFLAAFLVLKATSTGSAGRTPPRPAEPDLAPPATLEVSR